MRLRGTHWFAAAAILGFTLYGASDGIQTHQLIPGIISGIVSGLVIGLIILDVGSVVVWLCRQFRERAPRVAWWVGNILFWLGSAFAVYCLGSMTYAVYHGAPASVVTLLLELSVGYFVLGWGARRLIAPAWSPSS
jgi:hypothetical protein